MKVRIKNFKKRAVSLFSGLCLPGLALLGTAFLLGAASPKATQSKWTSIEVPATNEGLIMCPRLIDTGKLTLGWGWTNKATKIEKPEYTFSVLDGDKWSTPRPPFFGSDVGNLRCLEMATAKFTTGMIYQRNTDQSRTAFDVLFSISVDKGWSWTSPIVADSFIHEETTGTDVTIAGVGGTRPTFCFGWLAEARQVKFALLDSGATGNRPRANSVGRYAKGEEHITLAGESNKGGFVGVWNDGSSLRSVRIKPLGGEAEEPMLVENVKVGHNFQLTDNKGTHPLLVFDLKKVKKSDSGRRQVRAWNKGAWETVKALPPAAGDIPNPLRIEACQDENGQLHVASLSRTGDTITYSTLKDGRFTQPEVAINLKPMIGVTGFDITCSDGKVYVTAGQGPFMHLACKENK